MLRTVKYCLLFLGLILLLSCEKGKLDNDYEESSHIYGLKGDNPWKVLDDNMTTVYYPSPLKEGSSIPTVLFIPGWTSVHHEEYKSMLEFIASHGYMAIYAKDDKGTSSSKHFIKYYNKTINHSKVSSYIDKSKIGVIGHSSGGGHAFKILKEFSSEGWGSKGRFLLVLEPWFTFDMNKSDMQKLPSNTNVLFIQFGKGGENLQNNTDPRIPLSEYYLLSSIEESQKNYQIVEDATHSYPVGDRDYKNMQGILKPLDALMEYTFKSPINLKAHRIALEQGSVDPYDNGKGIQHVKAKDKYHFKCDGNDSSGVIKELVRSDIDYCAIKN